MIDLHDPNVEIDEEKLELVRQKMYGFIFPNTPQSAADAAAFEKELFAALDENEGREILLDAKNLKYISSAGLRVLVKLRKRVGMELPIVNVSDDVFEVFQMTNFTDLFDISKKMREITLGARDALLKGVNGMTYQMDDDTMLKVYRKGTKIKDVKKEREDSHTALVCGIPTLIPYDVVAVGDSYGIGSGDYTSAGDSE